jgi:hypothetical protein
VIGPVDARWILRVLVALGYTLMNLELSWKITRFHLGSARKHLPSSFKENAEGGSLANFEEYLSYNELGLAFDELEMIGMENDCPPEFWRDLIAAAENMELFEEAEKCRGRLR